MSRSPIAAFFFLLLLIPLFAGHSYGQRDNDPLIPGSTFEVTGQVRSADNRTIENVTVRLESLSGALVDQGNADSLGRFRFSRLRSGSYRISAKALGVIASTQEISLTRALPRIHVLLHLVPEIATFRGRETGRAGTIDARVPSQARTAYEKSRAALADMKRDEAITQLEKAIRIYPDFFQAQLLLGKIHMDENQWTKAEDALRLAMKIDPKSVVAMTSLGEVYRRQKKYAEAQKLLEEALKFDNDSWEVNYTLGRVHWELKDFAKSGLYIARTIQLQPDLPDAHLLAGNIFIRAGLPRNALVEYEEYLRLSPQGEFSVQVRQLVDKLKKPLPSQ
jgi:tetratricopeptide (TPR) repeat protein